MVGPGLAAEAAGSWQLSSPAVGAYGVRSAQVTFIMTNHDGRHYRASSTDHTLRLLCRKEHNMSEVIGGAMSTVVMHNAVSVDGFIADEKDDVGPLFEWYFNGDMPIADEAGEQRHAPFRVSGRSHQFVSSFWGSIGATIKGRHLFDLTDGWRAEPPAGEHLIVVSHR